MNNAPATAAERELGRRCGVERRLAAVALVAFGVLAVGCSDSPAPVPVEVLAATATREAPTSTTIAPVPTTIAPVPATTAPVPTTLPPVQATTPALPDAVAQPMTDADKIAQAKLLVNYDWPRLLPGWTIIFKGPNGGQRGGTYHETRTIEIFVSPGQSVELIAHTLAHELGHAVDITYLWLTEGDTDHKRFNELRGRAADTPWVDPSASGYEADFGEPVGDFAECFAWTVTNGAGGFFSRMGPPPDDATRTFIDQVARR